MSGTVGERKRLLTVTAGNLCNNHLYVNANYDFFPADCIGGPRRRGAAARPIQIVLEGLNETIETDIGTHARDGKPRGFFRGRTWVRRFFERHEVKTGDVLALERPMSGRGTRTSDEARRGD